jgi:nitrogen fixation NifU-like protein
MAYSDKVVDHYNHPRNVGSLDKSDPTVGTGLVGAPECGDVMKLQMKINPETQVIEEAKFKTFGCGSAIASSSLATEWVKGKTVEEALSIKNTDIVRERAVAPAGEDPLFRARGGRHQGGHQRLEAEERRGGKACNVFGRRPVLSAARDLPARLRASEGKSLGLCPELQGQDHDSHY